MALLERKINFNRRKNGSLSVRMPSKLPLPYRVEYTIVLGEESRGFIFGAVMFGLPLDPQSLKELVGFLNDSISDLSFDGQPVYQILSVADWIEGDDIRQSMRVFARACDVLYPLIMHIRRERVWSEDLVRLALLPIHHMLCI
jgi:hypothetical protein